MAINKSTIFETDQQELAEFCKALGHPARVAIMHLLLERKSCVCGDITEELPLAQSTVSQHLKALKKSGLIKGEVEGAKTCYCINEEILPTFTEAMKEFINICEIYNKNQECC
jgi:ArsR family transcriptional regulator